MEAHPFERGIMENPRRGKTTEFVENLRKHNPSYAGFEHDLIADISRDPHGVHYVAVAAESASGKGEFVRQVSISLNQNEHITGMLRAAGVRSLKHYHAAIGRTQNETAVRVGILSLVDGVIPRGSIKRPQYTDTSEHMAHKSSLAVRTIKGPAILWDDSVWITAIRNKRGKIVGEERGSIAWLEYALAELHGKVAILETDPPVQLEELATREELRASPADQAPTILGQRGIILEKGAEADAKETAEKSGTHKSLAHTRRTLTLMMHRNIQSGELNLPDFDGLSLSEFRTRVAASTDDWMVALHAWDVLWGKRIARTSDYSDYVPAGVYIFQNFKYEPGVRRHRYKGIVTKVEDALAEMAAKSSSRYFRQEVESLGIIIP